MKKLTVFLVMSLAMTASALAEGIHCTGPSRDMFVHLALSETTGVLGGILQEGFVRAGIGCKPTPIDGDIKCVGLWSLSVTKDGKLIDNVTRLNIKLNKDGTGSGSYVSNWDERQAGEAPTISLTCTTQ
jgi:hypothetical protein